MKNIHPSIKLQSISPKNQALIIINPDPTSQSMVEDPQSIAISKVEEEVETEVVTSMVVTYLCGKYVTKLDIKLIFATSNMMSGIEEHRQIKGIAIVFHQQPLRHLPIL